MNSSTKIASLVAEVLAGALFNVMPIMGDVVASFIPDDDDDDDNDSDLDDDE